MNGFLLDENVPSRLTFTPSLPVLSVSAVFGKSASDTEVWEYAKAHQLVIVTKDADFTDKILSSSAPPWIVHLRFGNMRRKAFHETLCGRWIRIELLLKEHKLVSVFEDRLEAVG